MFYLKIMSTSPFKSLNHLKAIRVNSIFALRTQLSGITCKWSIERKYAFVEPQNHVNWSIRANKPFENNWNEFYLRTSDMTFMRNLEIIYWREICICLTSKSCQRVFQLTKPFENNSRELYFLTSNTTFVHNMEIIYWWVFFFLIILCYGGLWPPGRSL